MPPTLPTATQLLSRPQALLLIIVLWALIYLPNLGVPELKSEEGRRAQPGVTMLESGNWFVPQIGGEPYFRKPPFINWLTAGSFALFGVNDTAARIPSVVFVLLVPVFLLLLKGDWLDFNGKLIAALAFLTNIALVEKGRMIEIEAVFVGWITIALLWWIDTTWRGKSAWLTWLPIGVLIGVALLTKGPITFMFVYVPILCVMLYRRKWWDVVSIAHLVSLVIGCVGFSFWAWLAKQNTPPTAEEVMTTTWWSQLFAFFWPDRFDGGRWAMSGLQGLLNFLPWLFLLPLAWVKSFTRNIPEKQLPVFKGIRLSLTLCFIATHISPGTEGRYSMPALIQASLLVGWVMAGHRKVILSDRIWRELCLVVLSLAAIGAWGCLVRYGVSAVGIIVACALTIAAGLVWWRRTMLLGPVRQSILTAVCVAAMTLIYAVHITPVFAAEGKRRPAAAAINEIVPADQAITLYHPAYQSFIFYLRRPVAFVHRPEDIPADLEYLVIKQHHLEEIASAPSMQDRPFETVYVLSERIRGNTVVIRFLQE